MAAAPAYQRGASFGWNWLSIVATENAAVEDLTADDLISVQLEPGALESEDPATGDPVPEAVLVGRPEP